MSEVIDARAPRGAVRTAGRVPAGLVGLGAFVGAAGLAFYSAYGDPYPKADQKAGVPVMIVASGIVAAIVFLVLVPRALRSIREERAHSARWGLSHSIVALVLTPVAFWSGLPVILAVAGAWLGWRTREQREAAGSPTRIGTAAFVIGLIALAGSVLLSVLGNTVLAHA